MSGDCYVVCCLLCVHSLRLGLCSLFVVVFDRGVLLVWMYCSLLVGCWVLIVVCD